MPGLFFVTESRRDDESQLAKAPSSEEFDMSPCYALEHMKIAARVAQPAKVARIPNSSLPEQRNLGRLRYIFRGAFMPVAAPGKNEERGAGVGQTGSLP